MRVIFMGTPDFSVPVLEALTAKHDVVCVYTRAPKEAGRGKRKPKRRFICWQKAGELRCGRRKTLRT
ncbi:MAG: hypothetical protein ACLU99_14675 [Alphaproteobacteria bacterium]